VLVSGASTKPKFPLPVGASEWVKGLWLHFGWWGDRGDSEYPSDIIGVLFWALKRMNRDLKLRLKVMGSHLGAQKGTQAWSPEASDWSLHPDLGIPPEKPRPLDYKGKVNRKEGPAWRGFPSAQPCPPFLILREREPWVTVSNKGYAQVSSWLPGLLSLTYSRSNWQTQSSSDPNFDQKTVDLRMGPCVQIKRQYLIICCLLFASGPRVIRPIF
jgi:hypothetical protein